MIDVENTHKINKNQTLVSTMNVHSSMYYYRDRRYYFKEQFVQPTRLNSATRQSIPNRKLFKSIQSNGA